MLMIIARPNVVQKVLQPYDEHVEQEDAQHAIAVDASEGVRLALRQMDKPQYQRQEKQQHTSRSYEAFLLTDGTEDEVGVLFRHKLQLCLRAIEEALALQTTGTDGYLTLMHVIASTLQVFLQS